VKIQETRINIQEASKDLQMGGIMLPKYWDKLFEDEDLKTTENQRLGLKERHHAPRTWEKRLGQDLTNHAPRPFSMHHMQKVGAQLSFIASVLDKARTFIPNSDRNSHYKYQHSSFRISRLEL